MPDTLLQIADGDFSEHTGNLQRSDDVWHDLHPGQVRAIRDSLKSLGHNARSAGKPLGEDCEAHGIRWVARVRADGSFESLHIDPSPEPDPEALRAPGSGEIGTEPVNLPPDGMTLTGDRKRRVHVRIEADRKTQSVAIAPGGSAYVDPASYPRKARVIGRGSATYEAD